jgi:heme/copper-type cytochrome/quinol oxidase subunit 2
MAAAQTMPMPASEAMSPMPAGGHDMHGMSDMPAVAPAAPAAPRHGGADSHEESGTDPAAHGSLAGNPGAAPVDVYLLAYRFGFAPEELRLEAGRPYRFRMMASDIAHGASLNFGGGSRIIRLRPNVVSEQTITFQRPGPVLVYCTVFCGPAHDAMKARILVA